MTNAIVTQVFEVNHKHHKHEQKKTFDKSEFCNMFTRIDELKGLVKACVERQQYENLESDSLKNMHTNLIDCVVGDRKQIEKIQPQCDNHGKVKSMLKRLLILNQTRQSVKTNLVQ